MEKDKKDLANNSLEQLDFDGIKPGYKMVRGTSPIIPVTTRHITDGEWEEILREATRSGRNTNPPCSIVPANILIMKKIEVSFLGRVIA